MMMMTMVAYCGSAARRGGIALNHRVTVVAGNAATATTSIAAQIYCVGMIVTVSAAYSATANYDIVTVAVVVLKASVVVDYYAMVANATADGVADCTTVAVVVAAVLIGVARCGNYVMLLVLSQVLL